MKKIQIILLTIAFCLTSLASWAQQANKISGKILNANNQPIKGAVVSVSGSEDVITDENGSFQTSCANPEKATIKVWAAGFYNVLQPVDQRTDLRIVMIPENTYRYNQTKVLPGRIEINNNTTSAENIGKKDFLPASMKIDRALAGQIAGLQTTRNSGMPGEGSYMNLRGVRSFIGNNAPLIVINGVPYVSDTHSSPLIEGLSRDILGAYNINDIQNITVLKGAEAAMYGSMGANGVILIETDGATSDNLNTEISYYGQFGLSWNNKRMPLLNGLQYKSYLSDIGLGYYSTMDDFFTNFPFMSDNMNAKYTQYYNNNTDWQDEIYQKGFVTDNLFRVEGGDAIAKYDLSLGYSSEEGILSNTKTDRYHTMLNGNILVSKNFEITATVGLAYMNGNYQEQGINLRSNPMMAAYIKSPLLSPYEKTMEGLVTPVYSNYYYGACQDMTFAVSNPLAIVNTLDARNRQYDVNIKAGFNYRPIQDLNINGNLGIYYNYNKEHVFIPGRSDLTITPLRDFYGAEENTVRDGVAEAVNYFFNLNANYKHTFNNRHAINVLGGVQALLTRQEYDGAYSRQTTNDFYQTMNLTTGTYFGGYLEKWNWMSFYGHADYTYNNTLNLGLNISADGTSATGKNAKRFYVYPGVSATWMIKNMPFLIDKTWLNTLNLRAEYSLTGNSRFSSNYAKSYYVASVFQKASGITRSQIPNTCLKPEMTRQLNLSLEASILRNRITVGANYYNATTNDVIMAQNKSSVYGTIPYYMNCGKIANSGVELSLQASLVRLRDFEWIVGGNIAFADSEVKSLGDNESLVNEYSDDAAVISRVGGKPYEFYGLQADGVFATQAEADAANLLNGSSQRFNAGDVRYVDQNGDGYINYKDYVSLGSAAPDYFGGFYTNIRYKQFSLAADFTYVHGNKAYNAVRRQLESVSTFGNQSEAVSARWNVEGQVTDIPRATYNDPMGNSDFSSRWIEDASFLRMKNITLSYNFDKPVWNFFRSGTIYVTGENLLTFTKYLGMDPEFAYSSSDCATQGFDYAKVMQPKSVKLGINLKF